MTPEEKVARVNEVVAALIETAKANLERCARDGAGFAHVAFPLRFTGDKLGFAIMHLTKDEDITSIHANLEANHCEALVIIRDAWQTAVPPGMDPIEASRQRRAGLLPSKEALITLVTGKDMPARTIVNTYARKGKAIEWEPQYEYDQFESWMVPPQWQHNSSRGTA